jgi:diguanylate cyclase (GGDEF)-like protein/PAS domain S-box-containing protein
MAIVVQVVMLAVLIGRTVSIYEEGLVAQSKSCVGRLTPALEAALIAPLLQEDIATIQSVLNLAGRAPGIVYLGVESSSGDLLASVGWPVSKPFPEPNQNVIQSLDTMDERMDAIIPLRIDDQNLGHLHIGLSLQHIVQARNALLWQAGFLAFLAVFFTVLSLSLVGRLLTRKFSRLTEASEHIARGEFIFKPLSEGSDDVGRMGAAFNAMAQVLQQRMLDIEGTHALLIHEKELLHVTLSSIGDGVMSFDHDGHVVFMNPAAEALTGWTLSDALGRRADEVLKLVHAQTEELIENPVERCLREHTLARMEAHALLITRDGRRLFVSDTVAPIRNVRGELSGVVLALQDVSAKREMLEEMHWQANHDSLTGLMNRRSFEAQLAQLMNMEKYDSETQADHALMYIDLDQFKIVNDTSGHMAGDELLRQVTFLMQQTLRKSDVFARLGGDEFGVLLPNCPEEHALGIGNALREAIHDFRFVWRDKVFQIGVSIGLVMLTRDMHSTTEVLSSADVACYSAKEEGRNRVHVYRADDAAILNRRAEMLVASSLREVLREDRFVLMVQEIHPVSVEAKSLNRRHFEVLLRMRNQNGEIMPADSFIPAAERYGVMPHIDRWVIRHTLHQAAQVCASGHVHLAINLSGLSIIDPLMPEYIRLEMLSNNIDPHVVCFEVTETSAISYLSQGVEFMRQLQSLGCQFALDDFGSGMSSFGYLKTLPVQCLKIDGAFVRDMLNDPLDRTLVESIQHIGKVMGMKTIAEYATSVEHVAALQAIGVDYVQGYALSKPEFMSQVFAQIKADQAQSPDPSSVGES